MRFFTVFLAAKFDMPDRITEGILDPAFFESEKNMTEKRKYVTLKINLLFEEVTWVDRFNCVIPSEREGGKLMPKYSKRNLDSYGFGKNHVLSQGNDLVFYYKYVDRETVLPIFRQDGNLVEIIERVKRDSPPEGCFEKISVPFEKWLAGHPGLRPPSYDEMGGVFLPEMGLEKLQHYPSAPEHDVPLLINPFLTESPTFHPSRMHIHQDYLTNSVIDPTIPYIHSWYPPHLLNGQRPDMVLSLFVEGRNLSLITSVSISHSNLYCDITEDGSTLVIDVPYSLLYTSSPIILESEKKIFKILLPLFEK